MNKIRCIVISGKTRTEFNLVFICKRFPFVLFLTLLISVNSFGQVPVEPDVFDDGVTKFFKRDTLTKLPHPTRQSEQERIASLRSQIERSIKRVRNGAIREFLQEFEDPYELIRNLESELADPGFDEVVLRMIRFMSEDERKKELLKILEKQLKTDPKWMLDGRVAWFDIKPKVAVWVFRDGRWFYSPIFISMSPGEDDGTKPIDFFSKHDSLPTIDLETLESTDARLKSLRETQRKMLEAKTINDLARHFLSPTMLAKRAVDLGRDAPYLYDVLPGTSKDNIASAIVEAKEEIILQLKDEPVWLLEGRIAYYRGANTEERMFNFWEFYEGRWRWNVQ